MVSFARERFNWAMGEWLPENYRTRVHCHSMATAPDFHAGEWGEHSLIKLTWFNFMFFLLLLINIHSLTRLLDYYLYKLTYQVLNIYQVVFWSSIYLIFEARVQNHFHWPKVKRLAGPHVCGGSRGQLFLAFWAFWWLPGLDGPSGFCVFFLCLNRTTWYPLLGVHVVIFRFNMGSPE